MDHSVETDVVAVASAGGFLAWRKKHVLPPGSACFNCGTRLLGPWCYQCGQLGEDYHRKAHHLIFEALEGLFHADGRLWHTLPRLLLRPASLTLDYLAGKRAPQVPPLRVFFVVLLLVFVAGEAATSKDQSHLAVLKMDAADRAEIMKSEVHLNSKWDAQLTAWTRAHVGAAVDHPDALLSAMGAWAHDFAFLTLPLSGLLLSIIFVFRRRFVLFDHLVFSMHSLSFQGILFTFVVAGNALAGGIASNLLWLSPVHLFFHMRGVYGTGVAGTVLRMAVLFSLSSIIVSFMVAGLLVVGLATLKT
jgi:hypothetical protein